MPHIAVAHTSEHLPRPSSGSAPREPRGGRATSCCDEGVGTGAGGRRRPGGDGAAAVRVARPARSTCPSTPAPGRRPASGPPSRTRSSRRLPCWRRSPSPRGPPLCGTPRPGCATTRPRSANGRDRSAPRTGPGPWVRRPVHHDGPAAQRRPAAAALRAGRERRGRPMAAAPANDRRRVAMWCPPVAGGGVPTAFCSACEPSSRRSAFVWATDPGVRAVFHRAPAGTAVRSRIADAG